MRGNSRMYGPNAERELTMIDLARGERRMTFYAARREHVAFGKRAIVPIIAAPKAKPFYRKIGGLHFFRLGRFNLSFSISKRG